jgi:hypothetical protein
MDSMRHDGSWRSSLAICALLCAWAVPAVTSGAPQKPAHAKPGSAAGQADKLRQAGVAALQAHDLAGAYRALAAAYRQAPEPDTLYELGALALAEERTLQAYDLFRRYLAGPHAEGPEAEAQLTEARRVTSQPQPEAGELSVLGDVGALLTVDNRLVGSLPLPARSLLSPGPHQVLIEKDTGRAEAPVQISPGHAVELRVSLDSGAVLSTRLPAVLLILNGNGLPPLELLPMQKSVEQAIEQERLSQFPLPLALAGAAKPADCAATQPCQLLVAERNEVEFVLVAGVSRHDDDASSGWTFSIKLLETAVGDVAVSLTHECQACDGKAASEALQQVAAQLLNQGTARPRGMVEVKSDPAGAEVLLDDRLVGVTPLRHAAWAGPHNLMARAAGYRPRRSSLLVPEAAVATLSLSLAPEPEPAPAALQVLATTTPTPGLAHPREPRPRWRLTLGGALLGGGLVTVGFGAGAAAINGSCIMPPMNAGQACSSFYATQGVAGALLGVGASMTIAGVILLAVPGSR